MSQLTSQCVMVKLELGHRATAKKRPTPEGFTHDWVMFVRGPDGYSLQPFVEKVVFVLHETFAEPRRVVREPPYRVQEQGYAGFNMQIEIYFRNKEEPKKIMFNYDLYLHLDNTPVSNKRFEKLTFQNPTEEFRKKLQKSGGTLVNGRGDVCVGGGQSQETVISSETTTTTMKKPLSTPPLSDTSKKTKSSSSSKDKTSLNKGKSHEGDKETKDKSEKTSSSSTGSTKEKSFKRSLGSTQEMSNGSTKDKSLKRSLGSAEESSSNKKMKKYSSSSKITDVADGFSKISSSKSEHEKSKHDKDKDSSKTHSKSSSDSKERSHGKSKSEQTTSRTEKTVSTHKESSSKKVADKKPTPQKSRINDLSDADDNDSMSSGNSTKLPVNKNRVSRIYSDSSDSESSRNSAIVEKPKKSKMDEDSKISPKSKVKVSSSKQVAKDVIPDENSKNSASTKNTKSNAASRSCSESIRSDKSKTNEADYDKNKDKSRKSKGDDVSISTKERPPQIKDETHPVNAKDGKTKATDTASKTSQKIASNSDKNEINDYMIQLLELQRKLMGTQDRQLLQQVVNVIEETGLYRVGDTTFDFDLCSLDYNTVCKLRRCIEAT